MLGQSVTTLTCIIVDDEQLARDELAYLLKEFPDLDVVASGANGLEAVKLIQEIDPDIVFLDVQMPGLDGLGVIRKLRESGTPLPYFLLATAYDQYAVEAFRLEALDYLLKPVDKERLAETVDRARRVATDRAKASGARAEPVPSAAPRAGVPRTKLLVRTNTRNFIVDAQDMVYATIDDGLITVVTTTI